jgi:hypothetical protein
MPADVPRYFPLYGPPFEGGAQARALVPGLWLVPNTETPTVANDLLGAGEFSGLRAARSWLRFDADAFPDHPGADIAHQFVYALWLLRPTPLALHHMFWPSSDGTLTGTRLISRATYNRKDFTTASFTAAELEVALALFQAMVQIPSDSRLGLGLSLSIESTWAHRWHGALMLAAAAAEAILTRSEHRRVAQRLATAYALLTSPTDIEAARDEFVQLHHLRSKIVHGRLPAPTPDERLEILSRWARVLRSLWRAVLSDPRRIAALQGDDAVRTREFADLAIGLGWSDPEPSHAEAS